LVECRLSIRGAAKEKRDVVRGEGGIGGPEIAGGLEVFANGAAQGDTIVVVDRGRNASRCRANLCSQGERAAKAERKGSSAPEPAGECISYHRETPE